MWDNKTKNLRRTAFFLTLVYLFLSGFVMVGMGGQAMEHGHTAHHRTHHSTLTCLWMCAAGTFVHSVVPKLDPIFYRSIEDIISHFEPILSNLSIFSLYIRPPPIL